MSIWNLIRDWFVKYIWGGTASDQTYNDKLFGNVTYWINGEFDDMEGLATSDFVIFGYNPYGDENYLVTMSAGDWLSTTSTIIVLVLLLIAFGYLIVNLFKMFSNIFSLKR